MRYSRKTWVFINSVGWEGSEIEPKLLVRVLGVLWVQRETSLTGSLCS